MQQAISPTVGLIAWLVAAALAAAGAAVLLAASAWRRRRASEERLKDLQRALADFSGALRERLDVERRRARSLNEETAGE